MAASRSPEHARVAPAARRDRSRLRRSNPQLEHAPISLLAHFPFTGVVGPSQPGKLRSASSGVASTSHLAHERILRAASRGCTCSFTSQAPAMQAIMAGQIHWKSLPDGGAESESRDSKSRVVAVTARRPLDIIPGASMVKDHGLLLESALWKAIHAPVRTLPSAVTRLHAAVRESMTAHAFIEVVRQQRAVPWPSTPAESGA